MNPHDNVELAIHLSKPPKQVPKEACFRGACGRAYYAAHIVIRDVLNSAGVKIPTKPSRHEGIIQLLKKSTNKDVNSAGFVLDSLRWRRIEADYKLGRQQPSGGGFDHREANKAAAVASNLIESIEKIQKNNQRLFIPKQT